MSKFSSLRTSAAGSYLGLYVLSAFTTGMFVCVLLYHYFTESLYFDQYSSGDLTHIYTTITWVCITTRNMLMGPSYCLFLASAAVRIASASARESAASARMSWLDLIANADCNLRRAARTAGHDDAR